jgi:hypothetical protein
MRVFLFLTLFLITNTLYSQCFELLSNKLDSIDIIPYALYDRVVYDVESGKSFYVKISDVSYKTKLAFLFQSENLGDSLDVSLITLNWKVLAKKIITKDDFILRYEPVKKSENYYLMIKSKPILNDIGKPISGCVGIAILERVTRKPFRSIQKIEWKK